MFVWVFVLCAVSLKQAERPVILIDGPFGDYEQLVKEGHKTVNFYVNDEVITVHIIMS